MSLYICWNDLHQSDEPRDILKQQQSLFEALSEHDIEETIVALCTGLNAEHHPHTYEILISSESVEKVSAVIEKDGRIIIYSGNGQDYKNVLTSVFFVLSHTGSEEEAMFFLRKLAIEMSHINQITARRLETIIRRTKQAG